VESWKTVSRRKILDHSKFLTVESHTVKLPDGTVIDDWPWIVTPDYINVVAVTKAGDYLCFRQTKYSVDGTSLAPVGGYITEGETPLQAAKRELLEETGYEASEWIDLGHYSVDANRGAGAAYMFLARGARQVGQLRSDDLEEQTLLRLSRDALEAALAGGEFKVLPWAAAVALALCFLKD